MSALEYSTGVAVGQRLQSVLIELAGAVIRYGSATVYIRIERWNALVDKNHVDQK